MSAMFAPIYTTAQVRELESAAPPDAPRLMERAGLAAAECARAMAGNVRRVLVVAGPGNNGGDAFEVAVHLKRWFYGVAVMFAGNRARLPDDASTALAKWERAGGGTATSISPTGRWDLVIDGLFGIGLERPLEDRYADLVDNINALRVPVLALDIPSGINADTGAVMGRAVRATRTITFIGLKPGLLTLDGPDHCGEVHSDSLGLDAEALRPPRGRLLNDGILPASLGPRPKNFHKGLAGSVAILGGATGMVGATVLAGRAALKCGAGRVYLALLAGQSPRIDYLQPELMLRSPEEALGGDEMTVVAAGPGMGRNDDAKAALRRALELPSALVLDADALNLVGEDAVLAEITAKRRGATLLTPHPAEAGRLLGSSTRAVQNDRVAAALAIADRYRAYSALKGNGTLVAAPDGRWWINRTGNAGMASAGMGDALTGLVAGLLAQGVSPIDALLAGVWLHGAAGDAVARAHGGLLGVTASEVIESARALLNRSIYPATAR
ncbi:MAG: bifunctional ADP-dependent (S)-NAD(P)H-hydrate dehydratase/NAD(P)H-hydrate epimerase [Betaproteobacteria bacterium RIFCSPLOWO2_02_FULL_63_19]|nr:MAG: bifunctional ADP-dependent (S)-NAD(P)H-hydrate dehydratase/NAD(P)H-hydrate epimerase [Betaproteobacteria bacterium RIFCSPLOWO2_02_FULL_63_19]